MVGLASRVLKSSLRIKRVAGVKDCSQEHQRLYTKKGIFRCVFVHISDYVAGSANQTPTKDAIFSIKSNWFQYLSG